MIQLINKLDGSLRYDPDSSNSLYDHEDCFPSFPNGYTINTNVYTIKKLQCQIEKITS